MARRAKRRSSGKRYCVKKGKKVVKCFASKAPARRLANKIGARCSTVKPKRARRRR